jgi:broad-specificity NMP kinase
MVCALDLLELGGRRRERLAKRGEAPDRVGEGVDAQLADANCCDARALERHAA